MHSLSSPWHVSIFKNIITSKGCLLFIKKNLQTLFHSIWIHICLSILYNVKYNWFRCDYYVRRCNKSSEPIYYLVKIEKKIFFLNFGCFFHFSKRESPFLWARKKEKRKRYFLQNFAWNFENIKPRKRLNKEHLMTFLFIVNIFFLCILLLFIYNLYYYFWKIHLL